MKKCIKWNHSNIYLYSQYHRNLLHNSSLVLQKRTKNKFLKNVSRSRTNVFFYRSAKIKSEENEDNEQRKKENEITIYVQEAEK